MSGPNIIIYDIEILRGIERKEKQIPDIEYCNGWDDHANMGITVVGAYDYLEDRYRVFLDDNKDDLPKLVADRNPLLVGFNNIRFDNAVLRVTRDWGDWNDARSYDLLQEIWAAAGFGPEFDATTHAGFGLDRMCEVNFGTRKTGYGGTAPVDWQQGRRGKVIDYCLNDIRLTKQLFNRVLDGAPIKHPKERADLMLKIPPFEWPE